MFKYKICIKILTLKKTFSTVSLVPLLYLLHNICKASDTYLSQDISNLDEHPNGNQPHLVLLFYLLQIFLRELYKSYRLVQVIPMDMSGYYENRAGPSNLGNVFGILLCKQITPDFNQEELNSIKKDSHEIGVLMAELQEHIPQYDTHLDLIKSGHNGRLAKNFIVNREKTKVLQIFSKLN
uniref:Uncharacterized protein n=1 Tax=Glossina austeni TaxID=7395 RepID=A0A1A9VSL6_GLOAU